MLTIRYRWKGKCPKHPRFDPAKHGRGAIKGSCPACTMLFQVYRHHRETVESATIFDEVQNAGAAISNIRAASSSRAPAGAGAVRAFGEKKAS